MQAARSTRPAPCARRLVAGAIAAAALAGAVLGGDVITRAQEHGAAARSDQIKDAILARKILMDTLCDRMDRIEKAARSSAPIGDDMRDAANTISVLLMAFPHLFPPATNQWNPDGNADPVAETLASPDIWSDFPDFYRHASAAAQIALHLSRAGSDEEFRTSAMDLRVACDTCHALYLETP